MSTSLTDDALLAAAGVLPAHFAGADTLRLAPLDPIQATTMSLPGGAIAVEATLRNAGELGAIIMVVTGLIDHSSGEVFDRNEARARWSAALTEVMTSLQEQLGEFSAGQIHMADAFDALEKADEADVVGVFDSKDTLAGVLLVLPATPTGEGAAAVLAAEVAAAEAAEAGEPDEADEAEGATTEGAGEEAGEAVAEANPPAPGAQGEQGSDHTPAGGVPTGQIPAVQTPGAPGHLPPGVPPGYPGVPPVADPYAAYYGMPAYPGGGPQPLSPEEAAAMYQQAVAARQAAQPSTAAAQFQPLYGSAAMAPDPRRIELLRDVVMGVSVELGRTQLSVQEILGLTPGSIVELDRAAGAPVDVLVNGTLIAHGEVVVVDEEFAVRISEVVGREGRITV